MVPPIPSFHNFVKSISAGVALTRYTLPSVSLRLGSRLGHGSCLLATGFFSFFWVVHVWFSVVFEDILVISVAVPSSAPTSKE